MPITLFNGPFSVHGNSEIISEFDELIDFMLEMQAQTPGPVSADRIVRDIELFSNDSVFNLWARDHDCVMSTRDVSVLQDFATNGHINNGISMEFFLFGGVDVQRGNTLLLNNCVPRIHISRHGPDGRLVRYFKKGDLVRGIGIIMRPGVLLDTYGIDVGKTPEQLKSLLTINRNATVTLPLPKRIRSIVQALISSPYQGPRAEIFLRAKFDELLCRVVDFLENPQTVFLEGCSLPRHKREAMRRTIEILDQNFTHPPSLQQLSRQAGLSQRSLARTFNENFSMSISEYLKRKRMDMARNLLQKGTLSILEVALASGYDDQSSFGRAYKRYFNRTPKKEQATH